MENASANSVNEVQPDNSAKNKEGYIPGTTTFVTAATATTSYIVGSLGAVYSQIGFIPQIMTGSIAAKLMSLSAISGHGGALISTMQSSGALFVNTVGSSTLAAMGAIMAPIATGYAAYIIYNWYYGENGEKFAEYGKWIKESADYYVTPYVMIGGEYCTKAYNMLCENGKYVKENINNVLSYFRNAEKC